MRYFKFHKKFPLQTYELQYFGVNFLGNFKNHWKYILFFIFFARDFKLSGNLLKTLNVAILKIVKKVSDKKTKKKGGFFNFHFQNKKISAFNLFLI